MSRSFPLAGLLRLRQVQQDQAAIDLSAANARVAEGTARQRRARSALGATSPEHIVTPGIFVHQIVKIARVATQAGWPKAGCLMSEIERYKWDLKLELAH